MMLYILVLRDLISAVRNSTNWASWYLTITARHISVCSLLFRSLLVCSFLFRSLLVFSYLFRSLLVFSLLFRSLLVFSLLFRSLLVCSLLLCLLAGFLPHSTVSGKTQLTETPAECGSTAIPNVTVSLDPGDVLLYSPFLIHRRSKHKDNGQVGWSCSWMYSDTGRPTHR